VNRLPQLRGKRVGAGVTGSGLLDASTQLFAFSGGGQVSSLDTTSGLGARCADLVAEWDPPSKFAQVSCAGRGISLLLAGPKQSAVRTKTAEKLSTYAKTLFSETV
jgi:hypothetical protein